METGITLAVLAGANAPHTAPLATDEAENAERRDMTAPPWAGVEQVDLSGHREVVNANPLKTAGAQSKLAGARRPSRAEASNPNPVNSAGSKTPFPAAARGRSKAKRSKYHDPARGTTAREA